MGLNLLNANYKPEIMLDIGIGSGILAIAACRLGIQKVRGVDIETGAVSEVERNSRLNGFNGRIKAMIGTPSFLKKSAPLVISNMLLHELLAVRHDKIVVVYLQGGDLARPYWPLDLAGFRNVAAPIRSKRQW